MALPDYSQYNISAVFKGTTPVDKLYQGSTLIYPVSPTPPTPPVTGDTIVITYNVTSTANATKILNGKGATSNFSKAELGDGTVINIKSSYFTGYYLFPETGLTPVYYTPTGTSISASISARAFSSLPAMVEAYIPSRVFELNAGCFLGCTNLTALTLSDGLVTIDGSCFSLCSGLTSISIPSTVTTIETEAFKETSLTTITIPSSVTTFGEEVFENCTGLTEIIFEGTTPPAATGYISPGVSCPIYVPDASVAAYQSAFVYDASRILPISQRP